MMLKQPKQLLLMLVFALSGCQSYWDTEPDFGSTVNNAIRAQAINPDPPTGNPYANARMDGVAAKTTVDNYQRSFIAPVRPGQGTNSGLITINSGVTSGTGSGSMIGSP